MKHCTSRYPMLQLHVSPKERWHYRPESVQTLWPHVLCAKIGLSQSDLVSELQLYIRLLQELSADKLSRHLAMVREINASLL